MKFIKTKKGIAFLAVLVVAVAASVGAYAYWTTTGAGSGSATNASTNGTLGLTASFSNGLTPGASEAVTFHATNPGTTDLQVGTVHSVVSIDAAHAYDVDTNPGGCLASDFTVGDVTENQVIPAGTTTPLLLTAPGSIAFADTGENQDGCKGAVVTLTLSS